MELGRLVQFSSVQLVRCELSLTTRDIDGLPDLRLQFFDKGATSLGLSAGLSVYLSGEAFLYYSTQFNVTLENVWVQPLQCCTP